MVAQPIAGSAVVALVAAALSAALLPAGGRAQDDCTPDEELRPLEVTPTVGGRGVTLGAPVFVRYPPGYFEDPALGADPTTSLELFRLEEGGVRRPVAGQVQVQGDVLVFQPDAPYAPNAQYEGTAFGPDANLPIRFVSGTDFDRETPTGPLLFQPSAQPVSASCDAPAGGYRVDVQFRPSDDDGPLGDLEYLLYLTRGPQVTEPELRARLRNFAGADRIPMGFVLDVEEAVAPVCVTVHVVDGVGNRNDSAEPRCFDPITGNFFAPLCAASAPGERADGAAASLALAVAAGLVSARARRRKLPRSAARG